jgi:hypothetical protein
MNVPPPSLPQPRRRKRAAWRTPEPRSHPTAARSLLGAAPASMVLLERRSSDQNGGNALAAKRRLIALTFELFLCVAVGSVPWCVSVAGAIRPRLQARATELLRSIAAAGTDGSRLITATAQRVPFVKRDFARELLRRDAPRRGDGTLGLAAATGPLHRLSARPVSHAAGPKKLKVIADEVLWMLASPGARNDSGLGSALRGFSVTTQGGADDDDAMKQPTHAGVQHRASISQRQPGRHRAGRTSIRSIPVKVVKHQ